MSKTSFWPPSPPVAHVLIPYLPLSEIWAYELIVHQRRYPPLVLTTNTRNLDLFPLPQGRIVALEGRPLADRLRTRLKNRLLGVPNPPFVEAIEHYGAPLIHAHFADVGWTYLPVARRTGRPLIASFYGYDVQMLGRQPVWRERYGELFNEGKLFLCLGEWMRRQVLELGCPPDKAVVLPFGADLQRFAFRERRWDGEGPVRVLMVATLTAKKGHRIALDALSLVRREFPNIELWIVGEGPLRAQIEAQIAALGLDDAVRLFGAVPYPLLGEIGAGAHLFMLPSLTAPDGNQEGLPMVLIEAQAVGLPTLSTYHACIPEVVEHGGSGLLAPEGDARALADNLLALLARPDDWPAMGARGREIVEQRYNVEVQAQRMEDLYTALLAG